MDESRIREGLTFDDVLLVPGASAVLPSEVNLRTQLTREISLEVPLVSSAMDTVPEHETAISMAQNGGIGVLHKNLSVADQAMEVDKVKRSESGMIVDPITMRPEQRIDEALDLMARYRISGFPVVRDRKAVGILTNRDLRFVGDTSQEISSVMTRENLVTVPPGTTMESAKELLHRHRIEKLLVVDKNHMLKGLITVKDIQKVIKYPNACKDDIGRLCVGAAVGIAKDTEKRAEALMAANTDVLVVDTAHGHSSGVMQIIGKLRAAYPSVNLIAGNVATGDATQALIDLGVDAVKIGIGSGSICTTRVVAGIGMPMISSIQECSDVANRCDIPIISDGGIRYSGDVTKAIAVGASSVMIGSLFAGTDESPGELILYQGRSFKEYRGMGSIGAMRMGSRDRYFQDEFELQDNADANEKLVPEGIEGRVPHKGALAALLHQLVGGVRAGMGYCGSENIKDLQKNANLIRVTPAGMRESHVHDVVITKEAPNYRAE